MDYIYWFSIVWIGSVCYVKKGNYRYVYAQYYTGTYVRTIMALTWWCMAVQKKPKNSREVNEISTPPLILKSFSYWHTIRDIYI